MNRSLAYRCSTDPWKRILFLTPLAGTLYPLCVAVIFSPFVAYLALAALTSQGIPDVVGGVLVSVLMLLIGIVACSIYSFCGLLVVVPFVAISKRLLSLRLSWTKIGGFCGAAVAYVCTLPWSLMMLTELVNRLDDSLRGGRFNAGFVFWLSVGLFVGPVLATFVGQVAGARAGLFNDIQQLRAKPKSGGGIGAAGPRRSQFSIRQVLAATIVASVLLTLLRLTGLFTLPMFLATTLWLAAYSLLTTPATVVARWLVRKRFGRGLQLATRRSGVSPMPRTGDDQIDIDEYWRRYDQQMREWRERGEQRGVR